MMEHYRAAIGRLSRVSGVAGALVVEAAAGVPVAAELAGSIDGDAVAALAASMYRRAEQAAATGGFDALRTLQLEADAGHVVVAPAGIVLVIAVAAPDAQLGLVRVETQRAAESLQ
jgi:predicted regulator of Ras-like GTPase activity (Roadblock/LC7/MglB family)